MVSGRVGAVSRLPSGSAEKLDLHSSRFHNM